VALFSGVAVHEARRGLGCSCTISLVGRALAGETNGHLAWSTPVTLGRWLQVTFFSRIFAETSYVRFVPASDHLGIACSFHIEKKVEKKVSPPISPFSEHKRWKLFFSPFLVPRPVYEFL
jgi:hypothetical protein